MRLRPERWDTIMECDQCQIGFKMNIKDFVLYDNNRPEGEHSKVAWKCPNCATIKWEDVTLLDPLIVHAVCDLPRPSDEEKCP